jgi:CBS-domain-containing membrane protein
VTIGQAAQVMLEHKISGLPAINDEGQVVDIITGSDSFHVVVQIWNRAALAERPLSGYHLILQTRLDKTPCGPIYLKLRI